MLLPHTRRPAQATLVALALGLSACTGTVVPGDTSVDGYGASIESGRSFFREGTLGVEGYWSDAVGLGQGLVESEFTTLDALRLGLQLDADAVPLATLATLDVELKTDLTPANAPLLNDSALFLDLLTAGAVVGLCAIDENGDEVFDLAGVDSLGISCALCHSVTDGGTFEASGSTTGLLGSIGRRVDGPAPTSLDLGGLFARATNSRALYPYLPQSHETIGGEPISRTGAFVETSTSESDVDALLMDKAVFPLGMWDVLPDGIGAPTMMPPVFDIRPAAPYGTAGEFPSLMDAINAHVTLGLDPTTLLSPPGAVFMDRIGLGIGTEIVNEFELVLLDTKVAPPIGGFPFVVAEPTGASLTPESPLGLRIDSTTLEDLVTYLQSLVEPPKEVGDPEVLARGALLYDASCAACHGAMDGIEPHDTVSLTELRVAYAPTLLLQRGFPFTDVLDDRLTTFDDRLVLFDRLYVDAQVPSAPRSLAAPRLTGLHLQSRFLHDGSIASLDELLDPLRGAGEPHPFYLDEPDRAELIEFLIRR